MDVDRWGADYQCSDALELIRRRGLLRRKILQVEDHARSGHRVARLHVARVVVPDTDTETETETMVDRSYSLRGAKHEGCLGTTQLPLSLTCALRHLRGPQFSGERMPRRLVTSALAALTLGLAAVSFAAPGAAPPSAPAKVDRENTLYLDLKDGRVVIKLLPELAPKMVERVKVLARQKFYDGTPFHRVIGGFMAQGGDPTGSGQGGSKLPDLPAEFTTKAQFVRGALGAARTQDPNSANSQFFIMFAPAPNLDGQYTLWGQVTSGMELVDKIKRGDGPNGQVAQPDRIVQLRVAADVKE